MLMNAAQSKVCPVEWLDGGGRMEVFVGHERFVYPKTSVTRRTRPKRILAVSS